MGKISDLHRRVGRRAGVSRESLAPLAGEQEDQTPQSTGMYAKLKIRFRWEG